MRLGTPANAHAPSPAPQKNPHKQIKTIVASGVAEVLLDRPKALNALNEPMVLALRRLYAEWDAAAATRSAPSSTAVAAIVLRAAPSVRDRAFCAGGDVKGVVQAAREGRGREALRFFEHEYACDWAIGGPLARDLERATPLSSSAAAASPASSPLPLRVALVDGIVMGGGVGLSLHGHAVVATERTVFAMPEVAIGLHPDVGAMARLMGGSGGGVLTPRVGLWLALSGARVGGAALKALGLATHCVPSSRLDEVVAALRSRAADKGAAPLAGDPAAMSEALAAFEFGSEQEAEEAAAAAAAGKGAMTARELRARLPLIERAFAAGEAKRRAGDPGGAVADVLDALSAAAAADGGDAASFAAATAAAIESGSALSAAVTLEYAHRVSAASTSSSSSGLLRTCLATDYGLVQRFVVAGAKEGDFWEGVRAKLIDRGTPAARWRYSHAREVPPEAVLGMFAPLDARDVERALRGAGIWADDEGAAAGRARL